MTVAGLHDKEVINTTIGDPLTAAHSIEGSLLSFMIKVRPYQADPKFN